MFKFFKFLVFAQAVALAGMAAWGQENPAAGGTQAVVTMVEGTAQLITLGTSTVRPLVKDDRLGREHQVTVGEKSRIEIRFPDGTLMRMAEKSSFWISRIRYDEPTKSKNYQVGLVVGRLWAMVKKLLTPDSAVEVKTVTAVAGCRGTVYSVDAGEDAASLIKVYDGEVYVSSAQEEPAQPGAGTRKPQSGAWSVAAKAGQQISVSSQGTQPAPADFDPRAETDDWVRWNRERDSASEAGTSPVTDDPGPGAGAAAAVPAAAVQGATAMGTGAAAAVVPAGAAALSAAASLVPGASSSDGRPEGKQEAAPVAPPRKLHSLAVTPALATVLTGTTVQFTVTARYSDETTEDVTASVKWKSSNNGVSSITSGGLASAAKKGTTTITAALGGKRGSAKLTVMVPRLLSLSVAPGKTSLVEGGNVQFAVTANYSDGTTREVTSSAQWKSSSSKTVTISKAGLATARAKKGSATVTASFRGKRASSKLDITVRSLVSLQLAPAAASMENGGNLQYTLTATYSDGSSQDVTSSATWQSSDPSVVSISDTAAATPAQAGTVDITASFQGKKESTMLTVSEISLSSIAITPAKPVIRRLTTQQFTATGRYTDGSTKDLTAVVSWSSAKPSVATITAAGSATGISLGLSTITATFQGKTSSIPLTVYLQQVKRPRRGEAVCPADQEVFTKWPGPRFTNKDGSSPAAGEAVVDRLTGLMWTSNANTPGPAACVPDGPKTLESALEYITCLNANNYLGYNDWRMPNRTEMFSLIDFEQLMPASWVSSEGVSNAQFFYCNEYWMITPNGPYPTFADMTFGAGFYSDPSLTCYIWPVRAGK